MSPYPDPVGTVNAYFDAIDARLQKMRALLDKAAADRERDTDRRQRYQALAAQREAERLAAIAQPIDVRGNGYGISPMWEYLLTAMPDEDGNHHLKKRRKAAAKAQPASSPRPAFLPPPPISWLIPRPLKTPSEKGSVLAALELLAGDKTKQTQRGRGRPTKATAALPAPAPPAEKRKRGRPRKQTVTADLLAA